ncbi:MAG: hypothetical protein Q9225_003414 [Loekoesia sp. 1 TL-2023]
MPKFTRWCLLLHLLLGFAFAGNIVLTFDNITTTSGFAALPSPYHHLSFSAYDVFRPRDPAFKDIITPHDHNCAVSPPNALLGSRTYSSPKGASFEIANSTAMREEGLHPYFALKSFYVKPMDAPSPGTRINLRGYPYGEEKRVEWHVDFPSGYHLPFLVKMQEYSRQSWERLRKVEITADFGEQELDWEFCLDDLEVGFLEIAEKDQDGKARGKGQRVIEREGWT